MKNTLAQQTILIVLALVFLPIVLLSQHHNNGYNNGYNNSGSNNNHHSSNNGGHGSCVSVHSYKAHWDGRDIEVDLDLHFNDYHCYIDGSSIRWDHDIAHIYLDIHTDHDRHRTEVEYSVHIATGGHASCHDFQVYDNNGTFLGRGHLD